MKLISKTTYKLRSAVDVDDIDGSDSAGGGCGLMSNGVTKGNSEDLSLELMEVPLSPTNYYQPPTPPGLEPPPPLVAELEIMRVLVRIRTVSGLIFLKTVLDKYFEITRISFV